VKVLVYTCVFGAYDAIFPPVRVEQGIEYIAITDQPGFNVPGWTAMRVDPSEFGSARLANRYYKMLAQEVFPAFDVSVYVDGNIRILGDIKQFVSRIEGSGAALGLFRHPVRTTVREEVQQCLQRQKVTDAAAAFAELQEYVDQGFADDGGLIEASILLRDHRHPQLRVAMRAWWNLFNRHQGRDQFSLPFVLWKTGVPTVIFEESFRDPNPFFGWYPHSRGGQSGAAYASLVARSHDSWPHRATLALWHLKWKVQRLLRNR
jgi:hypothetical protein